MNRDTHREANTPAPGEIISYLEMCDQWGASLQRGMNFHLNNQISIILMSRRCDAPYRDQIEHEGRVLIYEGHDVPKTRNGPDPKSIDQPRHTPAGSLTQNGLFEKAALETKNGTKPAEIVAVYEKIHRGIWAFNGYFHLTDCAVDSDGMRKVFRFRLQLADLKHEENLQSHSPELEHTRLIPSAVKLAVWKRDKGRCVICGANENLHFDHDLPYSRGGTSLTAKNIRLLCARHNLAKKDRIE